MKKKQKTLHNNIMIVNMGIYGALTLFFLAAFGLAPLWMRLPGRIWIAVGMILLFAVLTVILAAVFYHKVYVPVRTMENADHLRNSLEEKHQKEILSQQSRFAELQSQINPHFLYNTLESIRGLAVVDDNYKIADMTEALARYFRYNISRDEDRVPLSEELDNIKNYIHIQQYRFEDRFDFAIYCHDASGQCMNAIIPKMTLQPIVENAIYHGVENKIEKGHISIHVEATGQVVMILIVDDGSGMDGETLEALNRKINGISDGSSLQNSGKSGGNGVAMANIHQRIKLLFGEEYGLYVASTPGCGTEVEVRIPMVRQESGNAHEN